MKNPLVVDNTWCSAFRTCPMKGHYRHNLHLVTQRVAPPLNFGGGVHAGLAAWLRGEEEDVAKAAALKALRPQEIAPSEKEEWRTPQNMLLLLDFLFRFPKPDIVSAPNGEPIIEAEGAFPLFDFENPLIDGLEVAVRQALINCGYDGVLYAFILDAATREFGNFYVLDHKTTTQCGGARGEKASIYPSFLKQFHPNNQMEGYCWGLSKFAKVPVAGVVINGIGINAKRLLSPSFFNLTDYFTSIRFSVTYTPQELEEWRLGVLQLVLEVLTAHTHRKVGESCFLYYKACPYLDLCTSSPSVREQMQKTLYQTSEWNPLEARKKEAAETE